MQLDQETIGLVVQVIATAGLSIGGIRGMITALTARVAAIELSVNQHGADLADLRARYASQHPLVPPSTN